MHLVLSERDRAKNSILCYKIIDGGEQGSDLFVIVPCLALRFI